MVCEIASSPGSEAGVLAMTNHDFMEGNNFETNKPVVDKETVINGIRIKRNYIYKQDKVRFVELVNEYMETLRRKYPDCEDYPLYQILFGSSPKKEYLEEGYEKFDFPGDDSVLAFLEKTAAKLEKEKTPDETN